MNLYRLDWCDVSGLISGPCIDPIMRQDYLFRHATTARAKAKELSAGGDRCVLVSRIGSSGRLTPTMLFNDGKARYTDSRGRPR